MNCDSCIKAVTVANEKGAGCTVVGCIALKSNQYPFRRYGRCWAYSDDPDWRDSYQSALDNYRQWKERT